MSVAPVMTTSENIANKVATQAPATSQISGVKLAIGAGVVASAITLALAYTFSQKG